jgi:hypothetical protein
MPIAATLEDGRELSLEAVPPGPPTRRGAALPVVLLPRSSPGPQAPSLTERALERIFDEALRDAGGGSSAGAVSLVSAVEDAVRSPDSSC